jgi:hypothetical protein
MTVEKPFAGLERNCMLCREPDPDDHRTDSPKYRGIAQHVRDSDISIRVGGTGANEQITHLKMTRDNEYGIYLADHGLGTTHNRLAPYFPLWQMIAKDGHAPGDWPHIGYVGLN